MPTVTRHGGHGWDIFAKDGMQWRRCRLWHDACDIFDLLRVNRITLFFAISTYLSFVYSTEVLSIRIFGFLCFIAETLIFALIAVKFYHQSGHRDMYRRSQKVGIPENYGRKITTVIKYHLIMSNVLVTIPVLCTISLDWVRMGDLYTFPFADVLPIKTTHVTVYVCKYIVYALPSYFAHLEVCFLNVTFMYSTGVVKRHFQILEQQVEEAIVTEDEEKLKIAFKHYQEVLKFVLNALYL